ncbi:MAG: PIG-L family deacetylase [Clostridiaceae bacterium]
MSKSFTKRLASIITLIFIMGSIVVPNKVGAEQVRAERGVVELWKAIKPLTTVTSVMNVCAHPDDEHSALLAYTSLGLGVDTSIVSVTRGQGGQNEIGSELEDALSVLRTREYEEAAKILDVDLEILRKDIDEPLKDFGFSKSWEETLKKWGEDVVLERLVRSIRTHRPDVIFPAFENVKSTHGHHQAINILTKKAYELAQDPTKYPEHLKVGLMPWKAKKLYEPGSKDKHTTAVPVGTYDKVYASSYVQLGEESRYMHKCQGMGRDYEEGPSYRYYTLLKPEVKGKENFFDGIAFTFKDLAEEIKKDKNSKGVVDHILKLQRDAEDIEKSFPNFEEVNKNVHKMIVDVESAIKKVNESSLNKELKVDILHRLNKKIDQLYNASSVSNSVVIRVIPETSEVTRGQTIKTTVKVYNGGNLDIKNLGTKLNLPAGWKVNGKSPIKNTLKNGETAIFEFDVTIPNNAKTFHPYEENIMKATVEYESFGSKAVLNVSSKELFAVLPEFSVSLNPSAAILNTLEPEKPIPVTVTLTNYTSSSNKATVYLDVPKGWSVEPKSTVVEFSKKGEIQSADFTVKPPAKVEDGTHEIKAKALRGSVVSEESIQVIEYPHIGRTYFVQPSQVKVQAFDVKFDKNLKVGYISSGFDETDEFLRRVGLNVTNLTKEDLEAGNLSRFDTIVVAIRAYLARPDLVKSNNRLLEYVKNGGNLVIQYNKAEDNWNPELAPYPLTIGTPVMNWRVTDENSKVTMLKPEHKFFNSPNKITEKDWENWIQDRAAYNPSKWDSKYVELISTGDPGESEFTSTLLTTEYGKGTYTYSSLAWYRQVPNLVPGAYRVLINLLHK